jgi:hypothetical protein
MKRIRLFTLLTAVIIIFSSCSKKDDSQRFKLLTGHIWESDELLVDGVDESGVGMLLEEFVGDAQFKNDGTGTFGQYTGTWSFSNNETKITIASPSLMNGIPVTLNIDELTSEVFAISTTLAIKLDPANPNLVELSFTAK